MGLIISSYEVENTGIELENVYAKITNVNLNAVTKDCYIVLSYFVNKVSADAGKMWIGTYSNSFTVPDANGDLREQAYLYLKTLPEFTTATDL